MVILISGASCTGKTLLSQKILENHHISYYSIDHIKMGLYRADINCGFTPLDADEHIGEKLWPILKGIIMTAIENKQDLVIEGAYIFPEYLKDLSQDYCDHILPVFICFSESYIQANYNSGIIKYRHIAESRDYEEDRPQEVFIHDHTNLMKKCEAAEISCFMIQTHYEEEMAKVYDFISDALESA
ncbi:zeta toxin family protein [Fusibacter sp. Q10-2]|uniref:Zeta toxin family protein n=2 Tax=Fusibacter ferrireducens TaxID=2785058 RepID=A0ABR9ZQV6_9FIRM|nr:zeta toxin family protein [Fusibacter ferrireducens]